MASVNFEKIKSASQVKAFLRHCDKDERKKNTHSNNQINKDLTYNNLSFFKDDYLSTCNRFDARIDELDSTTNTNKRKDRVLCFGLSIPAPAGLTSDEERKFYSYATQMLQCKYGKDNVIAGYVHYDEVHSYLNPDTNSIDTSRSHLHLYIVPEKDGILNGKWFSSKANMIHVNNSIDEMCMSQFGVPFMTGSKKKGKSVEDLKRRSTDELMSKWDFLDARENALNAREEALNQQAIQIQLEAEKLATERSEASQLISDCKKTLISLNEQQRKNRASGITALEDRLKDRMNNDYSYSR